MSERFALVTGASRGLGKAFAAKLESNGFSVLRPSRKELDLADEASIRKYLSSLDKMVSVLINNAGENTIGPIPEYDFATWKRILDVNLNSAFLLIQHFAPQMARTGFGRIVNVSSVLSVKSRGGRAAYSASKAGLNGLTRTAAIEFASKNVLINSISPGFVDTELTHQNNTPEQIAAVLSGVPIGRLAKPDEIAECVAFLASEKNTYLTGQNIVVDGGYLLI